MAVTRDVRWTRLGLIAVAVVVLLYVLYLNVSVSSICGPVGLYAPTSDDPVVEKEPVIHEEVDNTPPPTKTTETGTSNALVIPKTTSAQLRSYVVEDWLPVEPRLAALEPMQRYNQMFLERTKKYPLKKCIFDHFQRSGGSTICTLAKSARLKMPRDTAGNCNWRTFDLHVEGKWDLALRGPSYMPCHLQREIIEKHDFRFAAREFFWSWQQVCAHPAELGIWSLSTIRNPQDRTMSAYRWFTGEAEPKERRKWSPLQMIEGYHSRLLNQNCDNFMIRRSIGIGTDDWTYRRKVTDEDLQLAIQQLNKINVVIPLERLHQAVPVLETLFGWKINANKRVHGTKGVSFSDLPQDQQDRMNEIQRPDLLYYEHVLKKWEDFLDRFYTLYPNVRRV